MKTPIEDIKKALAELVFTDAEHGLCHPCCSDVAGALIAWLAELVAELERLRGFELAFGEAHRKICEGDRQHNRLADICTKAEKERDTLRAENAELRAKLARVEAVLREHGL